MSRRVLVFDDDPAIRKILWLLFDNLGYEIFTFPHPGLCPLSDQEICLCPEGQACSDIIISDVEMPVMNGLDFVADQIKKGCRCKNIALMSGDFSQAHLDKASDLGIKVFRKPFRFADVKKWVEHIEKEFDPERRLANWYLSRPQKPKRMPGMP